MANIKLDKIAKRQQHYLVFDVLMAVLAALILSVQVAVLSGAYVPMAPMPAEQPLQAPGLRGVNDRVMIEKPAVYPDCDFEDSVIATTDRTTDRETGRTTGREIDWATDWTTSQATGQATIIRATITPGT